MPTEKAHKTKLTKFKKALFAKPPASLNSMNIFTPVRLLVVGVIQTRRLLRKLRMSEYFVYILKCADGTLYTGITTDVARRIHEHNNTRKAAKYTRSRRPVSLVYSNLIGSKSDAMKEEYRIKKMSRDEKLCIIKENSN